ncbi:MAG: hypothetical protein ACP5OB_08485 [Candidatus Ratteibacteria bacterium]
MKLLNKIQLVTRRFNRKKAPECVARVIEKDKNYIIVEFTGTKSYFACCFDENFVDYAYLCQDMGVGKYKIKKILRPTPFRFIVFIKG